MTILKGSMDNSPPPAIPILGGAEATAFTLAIYATRSSSANIPTQYSSDRLSELGKQVLSLIITQYLFRKRPLLTSNEIESERDAILNEANVLSWLDLYPKEKQLFLEMNPLRDQNEMGLFFLSYVGAIYLSNGASIHPVLEEWIIDLILRLDIRSSMLEGPGYSSNIHYPLPPLYTGPHSLDSLPSTPANFPPSSTLSTGNLFNQDNTLLLLNQTAKQKGVHIDYRDEREGELDHDSLWVVYCDMDGHVRGCGRSKKKKVAKAHAAREAYVAMGW
ncbi:hypothetical protein J3R30DRAFT_2898144 [Lentinula aciculospora]|uniref:Uncharacterized protein n=1 Tax=Lentinula aciculospora TaxID=153920 RepID=A0A9W9AAT4_9AGAR|nr:hypothetical protein J3R30DRAFT_2898144 [Lentinula aciculospora]